MKYYCFWLLWIEILVQVQILNLYFVRILILEYNTDDFYYWGQLPWENNQSTVNLIMELTSSKFFFHIFHGILYLLCLAWNNIHYSAFLLFCTTIICFLQLESYSSNSSISAVFTCFWLNNSFNYWFLYQPCYIIWAFCSSIYIILYAFTII